MPVFFLTKTQNNGTILSATDLRHWPQIENHHSNTFLAMARHHKSPLLQVVRRFKTEIARKQEAIFHDILPSWEGG